MTAASMRETPAPRVLLVEDDRVFLRTLELVLKDAGFDVIAVPDYIPALKHLDSCERIDLLLTDIVMPDRVNGLALARMARMRRPGLGVIYFTAYDIPGAEDEALGRILRKPFDSDQLLRVIRQELDNIREGPPARLGRVGHILHRGRGGSGHPDFKGSAVHVASGQPDHCHSAEIIAGKRRRGERSNLRPLARLNYRSISLQERY